MYCSRKLYLVCGDICLSCTVIFRKIEIGTSYLTTAGLSRTLSRSRSVGHDKYSATSLKLTSNWSLSQERVFFSFADEVPCFIHLPDDRLSFLTADIYIVVSSALDRGASIQPRGYSIPIRPLVVLSFAAGVANSQVSSNFPPRSLGRA